MTKAEAEAAARGATGQGLRWQIIEGQDFDTAYGAWQAASQTILRNQIAEGGRYDPDVGWYA